jgi:hypothetical protein
MERRAGGWRGEKGGRQGGEREGTEGRIKRRVEGGRSKVRRILREGGGGEWGLTLTRNIDTTPHNATSTALSLIRSVTFDTEQSSKIMNSLYGSCSSPLGTRERMRKK